MKIRLFPVLPLIALCLCVSVADHAWAQGVRYDNIVLSGRGLPVAGATITVCTSAGTGTPCTPLATIYTSQTLGTAATNPLTSDGLGNYGFWAAPGTYAITITGTGLTGSSMTLTLGENSPSSANTMYISVNGNDVFDGLTWGSAKNTLYAAYRAIANTATSTTNTASFHITGLNVQAVDSTHTLGGFGTGLWIVGSQDANYRTISSVSRTSNVVSITVTSAFPSDTWYVVGKKVSIFQVADTSFNGDFTIASVSGTTLTFSQTGANATSSGGIVLPFGFLPALASAEFVGEGASQSQPIRIETNATTGDGSAGAGFTISSISASGTTVTVTTTAAHGFVVGQFVRVVGVPDYRYNGLWVVLSVPTTTSFTYTVNKLSYVTLASQTSGMVGTINPLLWIVGANNHQFRNVEFAGGLPVLLGFDTNMANATAPPVSEIIFDKVEFTTLNNNDWVGPAEWIGSNVVWVWHLARCKWQANQNASVLNDQRAAVLGDVQGNGDALGAIYFEGGIITGGGGIRWRASGTSGSVYVRNFVEEGTGQSQPVFELFPQSGTIATPGTISARVEAVSISDTGDSPPAVRVNSAYTAASVQVFSTGGPASGASTSVEGPAQVFQTEQPGGFDVRASTALTTSSLSRGQYGELAGHSALQQDDHRRNFAPSVARFANSASQIPANWTTALGTGVTVTTGAAPDGTNNAGYLTCTTNDATTGLCAADVYKGTSVAFAAGDYVIGGVWVKQTDASTAGAFDGQLDYFGQIDLQGPTVSASDPMAAANYTSPAGPASTLRAFPYHRNDGNWQWLWFWWKNTTAQTSTTPEFRLNFRVGRPAAFYAPVLYLISGSQIAAPAAPTVIQAAGGTLAQRTYLVTATYVNARGETIPSATSTITVSANNLLQVTSPPSVTGATGWNVYVGNNSLFTVASPQTGCGQTPIARQNATPISIGTNWTEPTGGATSPATVFYDGARSGSGRTQPCVDTTNSYGDSEIADLALAVYPVPDTASAADVSLLRGQRFSFGGSTNFFGKLTHANTADRVYTFPDATATIPGLSVAQSWTGANSWNSGTQTFNTPLDIRSTVTQAGNAAFSASFPSVSGFGTAPSVASGTGSVSFLINVGSGGTASSGTLTFTQTAANGWTVFCEDITTFSTTVFRTRQTGSTTTTATIGNFNNAAAAAAWAANDQLACIAWGR